MKNISIFISFIFTIYQAHSQNISSNSQNRKPGLDVNTLIEWPTISNPGVSNNGEYVYYNINKKYLCVETVIKAIQSSKSIEIESANQLAFSDDSRLLICIKEDTLCLIHLQSSLITKVPEVSSYQ